MPPRATRASAQAAQKASGANNQDLGQELAKALAQAAQTYAQGVHQLKDQWRKLVRIAQRMRSSPNGDHPLQQGTPFAIWAVDNIDFALLTACIRAEWGFGHSTDFLKSLKAGVSIKSVKRIQSWANIHETAPELLLLYFGDALISSARLWDNLDSLAKDTDHADPENFRETYSEILERFVKRCPTHQKPIFANADANERMTPRDAQREEPAEDEIDGDFDFDAEPQDSHASQKRSKKLTGTTTELHGEGAESSDARSPSLPLDQAAPRRQPSGSKRPLEVENESIGSAPQLSTQLHLPKRPKNSESAPAESSRSSAEDSHDHAQALPKLEGHLTQNAIFYCLEIIGSPYTSCLIVKPTDLDDRVSLARRIAWRAASDDLDTLLLVDTAGQQHPVIIHIEIKSRQCRVYDPLLDSPPMEPELQLSSTSGRWQETIGLIEELCSDVAMSDAREPWKIVIMPVLQPTSTTDCGVYALVAAWCALSGLPFASSPCHPEIFRSLLECLMCLDANKLAVLGAQISTSLRDNLPAILVGENEQVFEIDGPSPAASDLKAHIARGKAAIRLAKEKVKYLKRQKKEIQCAQNCISSLLQPLTATWMSQRAQAVDRLGKTLGDWHETQAQLPKPTLEGWPEWSMTSTMMAGKHDTKRLLENLDMSRLRLDSTMETLGQRVDDCSALIQDTVSYPKPPLCNGWKRSADTVSSRLIA